MKTRIIYVEGMSCGHCVSAIEGALTQLEGVDSAQVDLDKKYVTVAFDERKVLMENLEKVIGEQGYDVKQSSQSML